MEYSKEFEMMVRSIVNEELNNKFITAPFCDERFGRVEQKMNEIEEMKRKLDKIYGIMVTSLLGIFSTLIAVLLRLIKF